MEGQVLYGLKQTMQQGLQPVGKQMGATYAFLQSALPDIKTSMEAQNAESKKMLVI